MLKKWKFQACILTNTKLLSYKVRNLMYVEDPFCKSSGSYVYNAINSKLTTLYMWNYV